MKRLISTLLVLAPLFSNSQSVSILQEQSQHYSSLGVHDDAYWDQLRYNDGAPTSMQASSNPTTVQSSCTLNKRVFGWHPYWVGSVYTNYQWNLLSDLCYFDYTI